VGVLIIGDNGIQNSINPATRSAPWPLTAAKAATGIRRMQYAGALFDVYEKAKEIANSFMLKGGRRIPRPPF